MAIRTITRIVPVAGRHVVAADDKRPMSFRRSEGRGRRVVVRHRRYDAR
ncbi:hypothetical protein NGB36_29480 [Streptomyces sp. RB6PN25]|uniref:Uncharacterized protein n=1 Tax=Streptomyces humicola TaxID=2953240 RepID=A0ABT1Q3T7_9ACTN|nr:hypothetical protein [Streptomyces humicola]MCQ4084597.1 hypothetical protein [Streptomyces humicola]